MLSKNCEYMRTALKLAAKAEDKTYPNPMVGAVVVKNGRIIGRGYHRKAGEDHAEIMALRQAQGHGSALLTINGEQGKAFFEHSYEAFPRRTMAIKNAPAGSRGAKCPKGAEMFVTLEPCVHYGKTPPCAPAIIKSGIKKVNIAMTDPNPLMRGRGVRALRKAGVTVKVGLCEDEARRMNRKYVKFITTGLPYVTVKLAQSLDGKIAARDGSSKWITSADSRKRARKMRSSFDVVMVGINTVCKDDPLLLGSEGRCPAARAVVDSSLRMPLGSNLVKTAGKTPLIIATAGRAPESRMKKFSGIKGVEIMPVRAKNKRVSLRPFLKKLARKGVVNVLVEGGGELAGSLIDESLVDEWMFFIAPKILGGGHASVKGMGVANVKKAVELDAIRFERFGKDTLIKGLTCSRA